MPADGETAPTFTATVGTNDHEPFDLRDHLGDGPVVLAFFARAFTPPCTNEMIALPDHLDDSHAAGATVFGVSADSAFFRGAYDIEFGLVSDMACDAIGAYGPEMDIPDLGLYDIANRAAFVLDDEGTVVYRWVADDPTNEHDYEELLAAAESV